MSTHVYKEGFLLRVVYFFSLMQHLLVQRPPTCSPVKTIRVPWASPPLSATIRHYRLHTINEQINKYPLIYSIDTFPYFLLIPLLLLSL